MQGTRDALAVVVEQAFIQDGQEGVEDGRTGLENLVDKGHFGRGEFADSDSPVVVGFESGQGNRAEHFLGRGEFCQENLKPAAVQPFDDRVGQHALGRSRRSDKKNVLARYEGGQTDVNFLIAFDQGGR